MRAAGAGGTERRTRKFPHCVTRARRGDYEMAPRRLAVCGAWRSKNRTGRLRVAFGLILKFGSKGFDYRTSSMDHAE